MGENAKLSGSVPEAKQRRKTRATTSKVRESFFNIIGERIHDADFLDLYAGTGAIGFEALKRGASRVLFVDKSGGIIRNITERAKKKGFTDHVRMLKGNALEVVRRLVNHERFDILFLDPPYHSEELVRVLCLIGEGELLKDGACVVAEHYYKRELSERAGCLHMKRKYRYGDTVLTLFEKVNGDMKWNG